MNKLKQWYLNKRVDFLFWWNNYKLERLLDAELRPYFTGTTLEIYQDDTQRKYSEGIATVKGKINSLVTSRNTEEYRNVLKEVNDLISLGTKETTSQQALRKILTNMAALPEKSKKQMINERIGHYEELREYNEQRALIREIKQARKNDNEELALELEDKWRKDYGKIRNPRRR